MAFGDVVQSNSGTSTSTTTAPTLGSATTAGNIVVLHFAADDYNGTPNTGWTQSSEMEQQYYHGGYIWWLVATASMTIPSYTIGGAFRSTWTLVEYEGAFDASPYDASQGRGVQGLHINPYTDPVTPTAGDRLLVAGLASQDAALTLSTLSGPDSSFTSVITSLYNGANPRLATMQARRVVTANGSTAYSTVAGQTADSDSSTGLIIAFKAGSATGTTVTVVPGAARAVGKVSTVTATAHQTVAVVAGTARATGKVATVTASNHQAVTVVPGTARATGKVATVTVAPVGTVSITVVPGRISLAGAVATVTATGEVTPEVPVIGGPGPAGEGVRRRFEIYLLPEEDDEKPRRKRKLRLKKAELEEKIETAVEYIEAGSPRPMSQQAMVAEVSTLMGLDALLEIDRRRVERTIYRYLQTLMEEEEEEGVAMLLLAA